MFKRITNMFTHHGHMLAKTSSAFKSSEQSFKHFSTPTRQTTLELQGASQNATYAILDAGALELELAPLNLPLNAGPSKVGLFRRP